MVYWVRYLCNCVRGKWRKPSYLNSASYTYSLLRYIHISRADQLSLEERRNALNLQATKEEKKKTKKDKERDKDRKKKKSKKNRIPWTLGNHLNFTLLPYRILAALPKLLKDNTPPP